MNWKTKLSLFWENRISFRDFVAGLSREKLNCYNICNYFSRDSNYFLKIGIPDIVNDNNGASKNGESSDRR